MKQKAKLLSKGTHADYYEVQSAEPYSVIYNKDKDRWNCNCIHGSNGFKGLCWHIQECQRLRK